MWSRPQRKNITLTTAWPTLDLRNAEPIYFTSSDVTISQEYMALPVAFEAVTKTPAANGSTLLRLLRHQADTMFLIKEKKQPKAAYGFHSLCICMIRNKHPKMSQVRKETFPFGICKKTVGFSEKSYVYSNSTLILGDSNVRSLITGQFDTAG